MSDIEQNIENETNNKVHKPYSKYRQNDDEGFKLNLKLNPKMSIPYLLVIFIFFMSLYLVFLLFDGVIMPSFVHSKSLVIVPNLTGKTLDVGMNVLVNNKLGYKIASEIYSEEFPARTIVKQVPYIGSEVKEGRTIYLTVSKGKETVSVPNMLGMLLSQARIELMKRGIEIGDIFYDFSDYVGKDSIISQSVGGGMSIPYGASVNITVSQGSNAQLPIPALIGLRYSDIEYILQEQGFILGNVSYQHSETFTPNTIIEQFPSQGELFLKGTAVDVIVSK